MGSFNKVGFLSSLPIEYGDETALVFLSLNKDVEKDISGVVYSTDIFMPTFLPIFGTYDDYGKIEGVIDSPIVKFIEEFFDDDINMIIANVDDNAVGRGEELSAKKNDKVFQKLTFALEHKSVYDKLAGMDFYTGKNPLNIITEMTNYGRTIKFDGIGFYDSSFARILSKSSGIPYVDPIKEFIDKIGEKDIMDFVSFNYGVSELNAKYFPSNYGSQSVEHVLHYKMLTHYRNMIVKKFSKYDEPERILEELKSEIRDEKLTDILK